MGATVKFWGLLLCGQLPYYRSKINNAELQFFFCSEYKSYTL